MNDRSRQALAWLATAAIVFLGFLLLYSTASQAQPTTDPARPDVSWPVLQTVVAFALFDVVLLVGLVFARLRSQPTSLSPMVLLITAVVAAILSLALLVIVLDWPLTLGILLWTLVLIAGFALLLTLGMIWSASRRASEPTLPALDKGSQEPFIEDTFVQATAETPTEHQRADDADPLTYLITLLDGDREAAERLVSMEQTLDPAASHKDCVARAIYKLLRDRA